MPQTSRTNDFAFNVPDDWVDRSMVAWSAPMGDGSKIAANLLVAYDRPRGGESLGAYVNRQLKELSGRAKHFELETRRDVALSGRPAVELLFAWDSGAGTIKQRQLYSLLPDGRSITIVNTAPAEEFAAADTQFMVMLNSFGWPPADNPSPDLPG